MKRYCPLCKDFDGSKSKIVKLKAPEIGYTIMNENLYELVYTHKCSSLDCGCKFSDEKKKKIDLLKE